MVTIEPCLLLTGMDATTRFKGKKQLIFDNKVCQTITDKGQKSLNGEMEQAISWISVIWFSTETSKLEEQHRKSRTLSF